MLNNTKLAENIRKYRERRMLTQTAVAHKLFVTPQTVSKWESGVSVPDLGNLCALSDLLGVSVDQLLGMNAESDRRKKMIGIDGGGTKTDFVLFCEDGTVIRRITLGGSNPSTVGMDGACETLRSGIDRLLAVEPGVCGIFAGLAGAMVGENEKAFYRYFKKHYPHLVFAVDSDILNVIHSVRGVEKCAAVICGTGSVVYGTDGQSLRWVGGCGYLFDGAGSGFDIGRDVISACLASDDGLVKRSLLTELAEKKLGGTAHEKLAYLYTESIDYIASFAPCAFEAADAGDDAAREILARNMKRLGTLIGHVQSVCDCGRTVIFAGGLSSRKDELEPYLRPYLRSGSDLIVPSFPPVYGACVKCMSLCGVDCDDAAFDEVFRRTLGEK